MHHLQYDRLRYLCVMEPLLILPATLKTWFLLPRQTNRMKQTSFVAFLTTRSHSCQLKLVEPSEGRGHWKRVNMWGKALPIQWSSCGSTTHTWKFSATHSLVVCSDQ